MTASSLLSKASILKRASQLNSCRFDSIWVKWSRRILLGLLLLLVLHVHIMRHMAHTIPRKLEWYFIYICRDSGTNSLNSVDAKHTRTHPLYSTRCYTFANARNRIANGNKCQFSYEKDMLLLLYGCKGITACTYSVLRDVGDSVVVAPATPARTRVPFSLPLCLHCCCSRSSSSWWWLSSSAFVEVLASHVLSIFCWVHNQMILFFVSVQLNAYHSINIAEVKDFLANYKVSKSIDKQIYQWTMC